MPLLEFPKVDSIYGLMPYNQYKGSNEIILFFNVLKTFLYDSVVEKTDLLQQTKWSFEGDNTYLQFYYENLFGFFRSFGESKINNLYDDGVSYDDSKLYDDATFTGFLDLSYYKILIKYFFDYGDECYTKAWLYSLVLEFCDLTPQDITITENYDNVVVNVPRKTQSILLERIFLNKQTYPNVPICDVNFNLT